MNVFTIVGFGIVASLICVVIKEYKPEYAVFVSLASVTIILFLILPFITPIFDMFNNLSSFTGLDTQYGKILLKSLGICIVAQIGTDICKDCGQASIASKIELGAKVAILIISLPLFTSVLNIIEKIMYI